VLAFKAEIARQAAMHKSFRGSVGVMIMAWFPMPKSLSKQKAEKMAGEYHTSKPDLDNTAKAVLDALCVSLGDDCKVVDLRVRKRWAATMHRGPQLFT